MDRTQTITIIGAGLAGSLLSIYMAKKGFKVQVYEKRGDMRKAEVEAGRSINLALSHRGIKALKELGIETEILQSAIPMKGRMLHDLEGNTRFVPYGKNDNEYINSISRSGLNMALMDIAETYENVSFYFNYSCQEIDFEPNTILFENGEKIKTDIIIGADGAGSAVRKAMEDFAKHKTNIDFLAHGYKELRIPPKNESGFHIEKNALHIWPRGTYMLIALPNLDGSFTCTLFLPNKGELSFESLDTDEKVQNFFETQFADALPYLPNLLEEFKNNPVGLLGTVKTYPWSLADKATLVGDAAHAIVPFYGQGMNASFEDCIVLNECFEKYAQEGWESIFSHYQEARKINGDAIADLAIENFYEMRDGVAEPAFLLKRELENILENQFPDYHSKYSMVTFHPEIPYSLAQKKGNEQNEFLLEICRKVENIEELNPEEVYQKLKK